MQSGGSYSGIFFWRSSWSNSALMVVEINNVKQQEKKRCKYGLGTGMHFGISLISKEPSFRLFTFVMPFNVLL